MSDNKPNDMSFDEWLEFIYSIYGPPKEVGNVSNTFYVSPWEELFEDNKDFDIPFEKYLRFSKNGITVNSWMIKSKVLDQIIDIQLN